MSKIHDEIAKLPKDREMVRSALYFECRDNSNCLKKFANKHTNPLTKFSGISH